MTCGCNINSFSYVQVYHVEMSRLSAASRNILIRKRVATNSLGKTMTLARLSISTFPEKLTARSPLRIGILPQKETIISHQFSGDALVSGMVFIICLLFVFLKISPYFLLGGLATGFERTWWMSFHRGEFEMARKMDLESYILRHSSHICVPFCICNIIIICHILSKAYFHPACTCTSSETSEVAPRCFSQSKF